MSTDQVWRANQEKVAFVKQFPGRIQAWNELAGKQIEKAIPLPHRSSAILVCHDQSFVIVPRLDPDPAELLAGIVAARSDLESANAAAYQELDQLIQREKELLRRARLEKILGAVSNNMPAIPELKEELLKLLSKL
jgi:diglucosylglycerate octanoyltransferase